MIRSTYFFFSSNGQGAAFAISRCIDDVSYFARTSSGRSTMRRTGVGAENDVDTLWRSTRRSQSSGSKWRCTTTDPPRACTINMNPSGAE
ncbi:MAG TPA: hypothetical protein VM345_18815 [Acidimicrobiales bacterium]|nr:hypothetical protein [Acidimicrobiales bacterium]